MAGDPEALYAELVERARALPYYTTAWPPKRDRHQQPVGMLPHRIETMPQQAATIGRHAAGAAPLADVALVRLLEDWLEVKTSTGSEIERSIYTGMDVVTLIQRLLIERPLVFFKSHDEYVLRSGETGAGGAALDLDTEGLGDTGRLGGFARVGTEAEEEPLTLVKTLSYDEMALSALLSVATPTLFINDGERGNLARPQAKGSFEPQGVFTGSVGARFEACEQMEWRHMIITFEQNTTAKGYGAGADPDASQTKLLRAWAQFYQVEHFPSYEEVQANVAASAAESEGAGCRYLELRIVRHGDVSKPKYLDSQIYKKRLAAVLAPWLIDSNRRALEAGTTAFCVATGLGLGAWGVDNRQRTLMSEVYTELLTTLPLPAVSDFIGAEPKELGVTDGEWLAGAGRGGNAIRIRPAKVNGCWRNPATKLSGVDEGKLLCAMYAWDGGAYPGNEFYEPYGMLSGSGDPAAACCSTITELGNPEINLAVCGTNTLVCSKDGTTRTIGTGTMTTSSPLPPTELMPKKLRRSPSAEGLHQLLARDGLSVTQRKRLLKRLSQRQQQKVEEDLDGLLQQSDAGLQMGRLLAERDALVALANPCASAGISQFTAELDVLEDGSSVAVITFLGSLNPMTMGHVQCLEEARRILLGADGFGRPERLEDFDYCLGLIEINNDQRVGDKMAAQGSPDGMLIPHAERTRLVQLTVAGHSWLGFGWGLAMDELRHHYPKLRLTHFELNGADDVVKYGKFWSQESARMIVMGRPGSTEAVREGMANARDRFGQPSPIDADDTNFILGPELPDISSSAARKATVARDKVELQKLVHPAVAEWMLKAQQHQSRRSPPLFSVDMVKKAADTGGAADAAINMTPTLELAEGVPPALWPDIPQDLSYLTASEVTDGDLFSCATEVDQLVERLLITKPVRKKKAPPRPPVPPPPPGGVPPPPLGPPPQLAGVEDKQERAALDTRTKMGLEIEQKSLEKRLQAGAITKEEQARLDEIKTLLKPPALVGDPREEMLAAITAQRVD